MLSPAPTRKIEESSMSEFVELTPSECIVIEAQEYPTIKHGVLMQPVVVFNHGKTNYRISDRHTLYALLKRLDPELRYLDMMQTFYDVSIEDRPSIGDIIQGYLHHTDKTIGVWAIEGEIISVEASETDSRYHETTMDYIGANFFPNYTRSTRHMRAGSKGFSFPVMVFSKDNIKIEILSHNQKTFIAGRYKKGYRYSSYRDDNIYLWVQPRPVAFCPRWAHLIPHDFLSTMLDDFRVLDSMDELTKDSTLVGGGGASDRLNTWSERNSLEGENVFRFDRKTIDEINSFCFEEE
jgi:hypothetical protein